MPQQARHTRTHVHGSSSNAQHHRLLLESRFARRGRRPSQLRRRPSLVPTARFDGPPAGTAVSRPRRRAELARPPDAAMAPPPPVLYHHPRERFGNVATRIPSLSRRCCARHVFYPPFCFLSHPFPPDAERRSATAAQAVLPRAAASEPVRGRWCTLRSPHRQVCATAVSTARAHTGNALDAAPPSSRRATRLGEGPSNGPGLVEPRCADSETLCQVHRHACAIPVPCTVLRRACRKRTSLPHVQTRAFLSPA